MSGVCAMVLAAGRSSRSGADNKLLAVVDGKPLVAHAVDAALDSQAAAVVVVTGHDSERVREVLGGRRLHLVHNPDHREGLSSSLRTGLCGLPVAPLGVLVCLGDMPRVRAAHLDALIDAFAADGDRDICVPVFRGRRGNPVLWPARCFEAMAAITGDVGARGLLERQAGRILRVPMPDDAIHIDVDTPEALASLRERD